MIPALLLAFAFIAQPPVRGASFTGFVVSERDCAATTLIAIAGPPAECRTLGRIVSLGWLASVCASVGADGKCASEIAPGTIVGVYEP